MFMTKVTAHITLRKLSQQDAGPLSQLIANNLERLPEYANLTDIEAMGDFIQTRLQLEITQEAYSTVILEDSTVIGYLDLHYIDPNNLRGEMGYWLDGAAQGKGIMTQCVEAFCAIAFEELRLHRIEIRVATKNKPSLAIAKKLGFHLDGILRDYMVNETNEGFTDVAVYSRLTTD